MIGALLFDLDGTLIDSDPIHAQVFIDLFAARGIRLTVADYNTRIHGRLNAEIFAEMLPGEDPMAMSVAKEAEYRRRLDRMGRGPGVAGAGALIDRARAEGWGLAVVTNAPRENAPAALEAIGLAGRFDTLVMAEDVARAKPAPDAYLEAMRRLGVTPGASVVFEDSPSGIAAGLATGATVIGVTTSLSGDALASLGVALAIEDFTDPALDTFLAHQAGELT